MGWTLISKLFDYVQKVNMKKITKKSKKVIKKKKKTQTKSYIE